MCRCATGCPISAAPAGSRQFELSPNKNRHLLVSVSELIGDAAARSGRVIGLADVT